MSATTTTDLPPSLAERFWSHSAGRESEDLPEPERSVAVVRNFLSALERLDVPVLIAMLRRAEVEGDLSYASPEQVRGENLDARAIVFSLGVVLFERLTGRHPFGAENNRPRRVDRIRRGEMGSGVNSFPTIPGGIRTVLVRAMSPFAEERWPDLREFRTNLRNATPDEMAPPPKLPGASAVPSATSEEVTKVVRMPTEFGQELMKVVDDHEPASAAAPPATAPMRKTGRGSAPPDTKPAESGLAIEPAAMEPAKPANPAIGRLPAAPPGATEEADRPPAPRRPSTVTIPDLLAAPARGTKAGVIAVIGAVAGAGIALALVFALRPGAKHTAGTEPVPEPEVTPVAAPQTGGTDRAPTPRPVAEPTPTPVAVAEPSPSPSPSTSPSTFTPPAPTPTPVTEPTTPAPSGGAINDQIGAKIAGCLANPTKAQSFGFSIMYKDKLAGKTYFDPSGPLSKDERTCITTGVRGVTADDAPVAGDTLYMVRINAQGMTIKSRALKSE